MSQGFIPPHPTPAPQGSDEKAVPLDDPELVQDLELLAPVLADQLDYNKDSFTWFEARKAWTNNTEHPEFDTYRYYRVYGLLHTESPHITYVYRCANLKFFVSQTEITSLAFVESQDCYKGEWLNMTRWGKVFIYIKNNHWIILLFSPQYCL